MTVVILLTSGKDWKETGNITAILEKKKVHNFPKLSNEGFIQELLGRK